MRKEFVYQALIEKTKAFFESDHTLRIDAQSLSDATDIARYNVSRELKTLVEEGKVLRINGRPVYYLAREVVEEASGKRINDFNFVDWVAFEAFLKPEIENADYPFNELIGYDNSLKTPIKQAKAALLYPPNGLHTLLTGPSGTGKTTFANFMYQYAIHSKILPEEAPYIIFNCADYASNPQLLLDHLFGHAKYAFTGADSEKSGLVEAANGGVLLLDEIHRLPAEGQEMLFSIMDRGEFYRLGDDQPRQIQLLIIGATTEDIHDSILVTFLRRIPLIINLPSLAERDLNEKIQLIYFFFKQESKKIGRELRVNEDVVRFFLQYSAKGNIGQLKNDIKLLCANALVDSFQENQQTIEIKLSQFSPYLIEQFYASDGNDVTNEELRKKIKLLKIKEFVFVPTKEEKNDPFILVEDHSITNNPVLENYRERFNTLNTNLQKKNQRQPHSPIYKIVSRQNYELIVELLHEFTSNGAYFLDETYIKSLALHIDTLLEKVNEGYTFRESTKDKLQSAQVVDIENEKQIARKIFDAISSRLGILLPESELYFIALYLKALNEQYSEQKIGVVVLMHGEQAATDLANTANLLLEVSHAVGVNMPLSQSVNETLEKVTALVKQTNQGKGVVILSDMGSLNLFGGMITKKTGIPTETIKMVTTPMVIEATRKSLLPQMTLKELAKSIIQDSVFIGNSVESISEQSVDGGDEYKEKIIRILNQSLNFLDGVTIYEKLAEIANKIETTYPIENKENFWIKFLFHTSTMLERVIRKEPFERMNVSEILATDPPLYKYLRDLLSPIENLYGISISDSELSYLFEMIQINQAA